MVVKGRRRARNAPVRRGSPWAPPGSGGSDVVELPATVAVSRERASGMGEESKVLCGRKRAGPPLRHQPPRKSSRRVHATHGGDVRTGGTRLCGRKRRRSTLGEGTFKKFARTQSPDVDAAVRTGGGAAPTAEALPGLSIYLSEGTDEGEDGCCTSSVEATLRGGSEPADSPTSGSVVGGDDTPPGSPVRYLTTLSPVREGVPRRIIAVPGLRIFAPPGGGPTPSVLAVPGLTIYFPPREVEGWIRPPFTHDVDSSSPGFACLTETPSSSEMDPSSEGVRTPCARDLRMQDRQGSDNGDCMSDATTSS